MRRTLCLPTLAFAIVAAPALAQDVPTDELPAVELEEVIEESEATDGLVFDPRLTIRANLFHRSWPERNDRSDVKYDTLMLGFDASVGGVFASAQYRFYDGYSMLHHGYMGLAFDDDTQLQLGVHQKPFGLLPYASHNYFFNLGYYYGLEDDYDLGAKLILDRAPLTLHLAYYLQDEGSYDGESVDSARYSYDIVKTDASELSGVGVVTPQRNEERNEFNARIAYTLTHSAASSTEFGLSGQWGQIHNADTNRNGEHYAAAAHVNGVYDRWNLQLQATRFENDLENPAGDDDRFVVRGAYDAPYKAAARGWLFVANAAYTLPIEASPGDTITFYTDYSYVLKDENAYNDSQQFVVGTLFQIGAALIYVDVALGRNHPFVGPGYSSALAEGDADNDWEVRFNINAGFYF